jgi:hypothetical protein
MHIGGRTYPSRLGKAALSVEQKRLAEPLCRLQLEWMLTRTQVARRLGKSIATVRRLEGRALHPARGEHDVRLFDISEVDRLKRDPKRLAQFAKSPWFRQNRAAKPRSPGRAAPSTRPTRIELNVTRAWQVAGDLERVSEMLLDIPASRLLRAGVDEAAFEVLSTAIEILRGRD